MPLIHYSIRVNGIVQGVGFRYATQREALKLGIKGAVRNEDDGAVAIEAEGERAALNRFRDWCRQGPASAEVTTFSCDEAPVEGYSSFEITA